MSETREAWLLAAVAPLSAIVADRANAAAPPVWVSVGWPHGYRGRRRPFGQCWRGGLSADGRPHIFVSPELTDAGTVIATLLHELIHAAVEDPSGKAPVGHKGAFVTACRAVGLVKPWTATTPGPDLAPQLVDVSVALGPYPHAALHGSSTVRPGSRLRLWVCPCDVKVRVASDAFRATCDDCGQPFKRPESGTAPRRRGIDA